MDILFSIILVVSIVCLWTTIIIAYKKKNKKITAGQLVSSIGATVLSIGLLLRPFELVSHSTYVVVIALGILIEFIAVILVLKQN